jgi:hypothetical protein
LRLAVVIGNVGGGGGAGAGAGARGGAGGGGGGVVVDGAFSHRVFQ